jgi:NAD(P)-dependent dehydrogenase (short-subunit alcohol dehydrogenase family)
MGRLEDKVSIVTGAGQGIGRAIAVMFAKEGSKVVVDDINPETGQETVSLIQSDGNDAIFVQADVSKAPEVERMVKLAVEKYGKISILVNNAAVMEGDTALIQDLPEEAWNQFMDVNLKGVYFCCKYVVPEIIKGGGGSIINISSMNANVKSPAYGYAASKGGLNAFTRSLALQLSDYNIRANIINAGYIITPGIEAIRARRTPEYKDSFQKKVNLIGRLIQRGGMPEDIAYAATYLASDKESGYITGAELAVDGGALR